VVTKLEPALFAQMLEAAQPGSTQITGTPKCAISTYYMKYRTVGGAGEPTDATGAIMVPSGLDPACSGARPVLLYAHGTTMDQAYNMANLRDNAEASLVASTFAAQGFIVVAPNYAGFDTSSLGYHPYLNAQQQASDMIDGLRAARTAFSSIGAKDSGKLLLTGYSQGGYVAMATQREMQSAYASEFKVTALAGSSGPYALSLIGDVVFGGSPNLGGTSFLPLITQSWQKSYGGMYASTSEIYTSAYAATIESVAPGVLAHELLIASGGIPALALFAPDSLPGPSSAMFASFFGTNHLIQTSYRNGVVADAQMNPCNVNPAAPLQCAPAHALRKNALKNDLRTYVPTVPTLMCGGNGDPTVFFASTQATAAYFLMNGMPAPALTVLDLDSAPNGADDPFAIAKFTFGQLKGQAISASITAGVNPAIGVASVYHGVLLPPLCLSATRSYFQSVLAQAQQAQ
jgi:pimeloyl-ACP methyl ester carboxylesterase